MRNIEEIRIAIEKTREELDALINTDKFEVYYEKSKEFDKLVEEYLDVYEEVCQEELVLAQKNIKFHIRTIKRVLIVCIYS